MVKTGRASRGHLVNLTLQKSKQRPKESKTLAQGLTYVLFPLRNYYLFLVPFFSKLKCFFSNLFFLVLPVVAFSSQLSM